MIEDEKGMKNALAKVVKESCTVICSDEVGKLADEVKTVLDQNSVGIALAALSRATIDVIMSAEETKEISITHVQIMCICMEFFLTSFYENKDKEKEEENKYTIQ